MSSATQAPADVPVAAGVASPLEALAHLGEPFAIEGGTLFRQGDVADGMIVVTGGEVVIEARTSGDDVVTLDRLGPGAVLGELSLIDPGVRSATARVVQASTGWRLSHEAYSALRAARRPEGVALYERLVALTCERIRARLAVVESALESAAPGLFCPESAMDRRRWTRSEAGLAPGAYGSLPFFRGFTEAQRAVLLRRGALHDLARGERLAIVGERAEEAVVILRGAACLWLERDGRRERCGLTPPGRLVSTVALMDGRPLALDAAAREPARVLSIALPVLSDLRGAGDDLAHRLEDALARELVRELRSVTNQVARLAAQGRVASRD